MTDDLATAADDPAPDDPLPDDSTPDDPDATDPPDEASFGEGDAAALGPVLELTDSMLAIAAWCGVGDPTELVCVTEVLDDRSLFPTGAALLEILGQNDDAVVEGLEGFGPARWFPFDPRDASTAVPLVGWIGVPDSGSVAGTSGPFAIRVGLGPLGTALEVFAPPASAEAAADVLAAITELRRVLHPLRGEVVRVGGIAGSLSYRMVEPRAVSRDRFVLPATAWDVLDRHVGAFLGAGDRLGALGLGMHVGVLVVGAPGTGKTALCRVLAEELRDVATTLIVDPATARDSLAELYALASQLAPTLVVIEHVEGAGPTRGTDAPLALAQFLTAVDLADDALGPIVTVFTTSEVNAVDASVRVGGRLHTTVELPVPDLTARRRILEGLLGTAAEALGPEAVGEVDVSAIARATEGATGADLHHILRLALLGGDGPVTTALLLARARAGGWVTGDPGMYL